MAAGSLKLRIEIDGYTEFNRGLHGAMKAADDLEPLFAAIAEEVKRSVAARFAAEGAADGEPAWAPLSEAYAAWKKAKYGDKPILEATGALREAATNPRVDISPQALTMTVENAYAIYHESRRPRSSKLPRRAFYAFSKRQRTRVMQLMRQHLFAPLDR